MLSDHFPVFLYFLEARERIAYTDLSLKEFFSKASKMPWYNNTLFVITGDHTSDSEKPEYQSLLGKYSIPFIFYCPSDGTLKGVSNNVMQQSIVLPTILDYLSFPDEFKSLSPSALSDSSFAIFGNSGSFILVRNQLGILISPDKKTRLYNIEKDPFMQHEIVDKGASKIELELLLKSYLQLHTQYIKQDSF